MQGSSVRRHVAARKATWKMAVCDKRKMQLPVGHPGTPFSECTHSVLSLITHDRLVVDDVVLTTTPNGIHLHHKHDAVHADHHALLAKPKTKDPAAP